MNKKTGIIGAMKVETDLLLEKMTDKKEVKVGMQTFYTGKLCGKDTVIAVAGIGKVNAAATAAAMILKFNVDALINTGVGGSLSADAKIGDTVIASACVEHDLDYNVLGDPRGTVFYPDGSAVIINELDKDMAAALAAAASAAGIKTKPGIVATGDVFVSNPELRKTVGQQFGASACEMEGAAIGHVCRLFGVPCAIVRAISDNADGTSEIDYPTFTKLAAANASKVLLSYFSAL